MITFFIFVDPFSNFLKFSYSYSRILFNFVLKNIRFNFKICELFFFNFMFWPNTLNYLFINSFKWIRYCKISFESKSSYQLVLFWNLFILSNSYRYHFDSFDSLIDFEQIENCQSSFYAFISFIFFFLRIFLFCCNFSFSFFFIYCLLLFGWLRITND